jgi:plastocyanin
MSTPVVMTRVPERTDQPALGKVLIAALLGNVLVNAVLQAFILHTLIPPLTIILALTVVVAGVVATRWRWAPLLAALWCVLAVIPGLPPYTYNLTHPAEIGTFIGTVLGLSLYLIAIVAGVAATVAGERPAEGRTPRWLSGFLVGVAAFALGASLVALIPPSDANSAGVSAEALAQLPALVAAQTRFDRTELRARVGETVALRLDNRDAQRHSFDVDELSVHVPMPAGTTAAALFRPTEPGTYTFYCQVPGHREAGMVGTLIVEP